MLKQSVLFGTLAAFAASTMPRLVVKRFHHASKERQRGSSFGSFITRMEKNASSDDMLDVSRTPSNNDLQLFEAPGTHYVDLKIGCGSPQHITLIVDTGSGVTAFPCSGCIDCDLHHLGMLYDESNSTCYRLQPPCRDSDDCSIGRCTYRHKRKDQCMISRRYNEGSSWTASEGLDIVRIHDDMSFNLTFGCQTRIGGLFTNQLPDGIMGMSRFKGSFWRQAYLNKVIANQSFGLCFSRPDQSNVLPVRAGMMTLGGADPALDETPMVYAEMLKVRDFFGVYVERIHLRMHGGGSVQADRQSHYNIRYETVDMHSSDLNSLPFIVDSGTTATYLSDKIEYPFSDTWRELTGRHYNPYREYVYGRDELDEYLPTLLFQLSPWRRGENDLKAPWIVNSLDRYNRGSVLVAMPPSQYMRYIEDDDVWVSRIFFVADSKQTLGSNFLQGKSVLFDVDSERMGFAESSCTGVSVASALNVDNDIDNTWSTTYHKLHDLVSHIFYIKHFGILHWVFFLLLTTMLAGLLYLLPKARRRVGELAVARESERHPLVEHTLPVAAYTT